MANFTITNNGFLLESDKVFIPSADINIFPCARRGKGQVVIPEDGDLIVDQYDPEARLNTERTNRLHAAINGFTNSFIKSFGKVTESYFDSEGKKQTREVSILKFVLAGYYIEVRNFDPAAIAGELGATERFYAYLCLQSDVSLEVGNYFTEILYRQSTSENYKNYLDVSYDGNDFFTGISFVKAEEEDSDKTDQYTPYYLPLFSYSGEDWELIQASMLPKIEHGETDDSIKIGGDFTVEHGDQVSFAVTKSKTVLGTTDISKLSAGATDVDSLTVNGTTYLKSTAQIDGETTLYNKLLVKSGNTTRAEIDSSKVSFNLPVTVNDTLQVKRTTGTGPAARVEGSLEVHEGISTETLNANTIQSVETLKTDNAKGLVVTSTAASPERTLKIEGKADISGDTGINGRLTVSSNIDTSTLKATANIVTPLITSENANTEIVVDRVLKVDTINSDSTNGLTIKRAAKLEKTLNVEGAITVNDIITAKKLVIPSNIDADGKEKGEVVTPTLRVNRLTTNTGGILVDDKNLLVTKRLDVLAKDATDPADREIAAQANIDKAVIGQLTVKEDENLVGSTGKITAKEVAAEKITQNGSQVPAITLEQISDNGVTPEVWQLQIANVIKKPKN